VLMSKPVGEITGESGRSGNPGVIGTATRYKAELLLEVDLICPVHSSEPVGPALL
jgi:hypothetical protein